MPPPDLLPIRPFTKPAKGEVTLPGSKSITNRALLLAALCDGPVTLTGALFSEDTEIMAEALNRLGIAVKSDPVAKTFHVAGQGGKIPAQSADLFVGNAGTAARFLTALCAAANSGIYRLDGVPQMRKRPMKGLIDALRSLGADIRCTGEEGFFPLEIHAHGLRGGAVSIDASESSQMLSALLMVTSPETWGRIILSTEFRKPFVEMTRSIMGPSDVGYPRFGFHGMDQPLGAALGWLKKQGGIFSVEGDATASSYFMALTHVTHGKIILRNMPDWPHTLQMDGAKFLGVMGTAGGLTARGKPKSGSDATWGGLELCSGSKSQPKDTYDFSEFSDTFLTLAAIAPLLDGPTTITGIAHTRKQETDRVAGMARELTKLGQRVVETDDSLTITPDLPKLRQLAAEAVTAGRQLEIETYKDHRFAMSFAILGCHDLLGDGRPWLAIRDPACCAKTFPNFFDVLGKVWKTSHAA